MLFKQPQLSEESHPFTLSSPPYADEIRISAKIVGDWTLKLPDIKTGTPALIFGPYGKFGFVNPKKDQKIIMVGGGIGVTPFISMLHHELSKPAHQDVSLVYSYRLPEEGIFNPEILYFKNNYPKNKIFSWCSAEKGRLTAEKIKQLMGDIEKTLIYLCGPPAMMNSLKVQFAALGVPEQQVIYEEFQFL